jgi:hypothetical protein
VLPGRARVRAIGLEQVKGIAPIAICEYARI